MRAIYATFSHIPFFFPKFGGDEKLKITPKYGGSTIKDGRSSRHWWTDNQLWAQPKIPCKAAFAFYSLTEPQGVHGTK
jgi:hypothetical protein